MGLREYQSTLDKRRNMILKNQVRKLLRSLNLRLEEMILVHVEVEKSTKIAAESEINKGC